MLWLTGNLDQVKSIECNGLTKEARSNGWLWKLESPDRLRFLEPMLPRLGEFEPLVVLSDRRDNWSDGAKSYLAEIESRLHSEPQIASLATQVTSGATTPLQKMRAIARYVQREYPYKSLAFGPRRGYPLHRRRSCSIVTATVRTRRCSFICCLPNPESVPIWRWFAAAMRSLLRRRHWTSSIM